MAELSTPRTAAAPGISIARVFDAPRCLVWKEWTEPQRFADWFGGPGIAVPLSTVSIDLRPGGAWTATTLSYGPDRRDIRWHGEYLEIIEPERLVFTIRGLEGPEPADEVTVILADLAGVRTEMLFRQRGQRTAEEYQRARDGWLTEFDRMAQRVIDPQPELGRRR
jgi:uncharacterized protein YndB with AHSA1/START domain